MHILKMVFSALILFGSLISSSKAALIWDFGFTNSGQTFLPTGIVELKAWLSNDSTNGEVIGFLPEDPVEDYFIKSASGNLPGLDTYYDYYFHIWDSAASYIVYPGDVIYFTFASHVPKSVTPDGLYEDSGTLSIFPCGASNCSLIDSASSDFSWYVSSASRVSEPSILSVFCLSLAGLVFTRCRKKRGG